MFKKIAKSGLNISLNWNLIFAFISFWSCGFFGYFSKGTFGMVNNILITIVTLAIFLFFLFSGLKNKGEKYTITKEGLVVFFSYFFLLLLLSWKNLTNPINGDHLPYVQHAKAHSFFIVEKIYQHVSAVGSVPFWFMTWCVEILIIVSFVALWSLSRRFGRYFTLSVFGVVFLILRILVIYQGGNPDPYPSFGLFLIWLSGVLVPGTDFIFRLSDFIPFVTFVTFIYYFSKPYFSQKIAWLFGLLIGTIPVFWHVGTLVEFSVWTAGGWTLFLFWLILDKEKKLFSTYTLIAILVVCSCIRVSGPAAIIFVIGLVVLQWYTKKLTVKELLFILTPCLLIVPILIQNHYVGSPAAYNGTVYPDIGIIQNAPLFNRIKVSLFSGVFINSVVNTFSVMYIIALCLLPVLLLIKRKYIELAIAISLFVLAYLMFYSIDPWLWGNGRYQAEYIFPFLAISLFLLLSAVKNRYIQISCIVVGIGLNLFSFYTIPERNEGWYGHVNYFPQAKLRGEYSIQSEYPMDFKQALDEARVAGYEGHIYFPGYLYLFSILSDFSTANVLHEKEIMVNVGASMGTSTVANINKNKNIQVVFIPMYPKDINPIEGSVYNGLKQSGWVDWKEEYNPVYKQTIQGLIRK